MPTQLLPLGTPTPVLQGVVYALPAAAMIIHSDSSLEVALSLSGPWNALTAGNKTAANFVRCTTGNTLITIKRAPRGGIGTLTYVQQVAADGATHYYRLGETSGLVAVDSAGSVNGSYANEFVLNQPGIFPDNSSVSFSNNGAVILPFSNPTIISVEAWVYRTGVGSGASIIFTVVGNAFSLAMGTDGVTIWQHLRFNDATNSGWLQTGVTVPLNTWTYLVSTWDGTFIRIYMNGVQIYSNNSFAGKTIEIQTQSSIGSGSGGGDSFVGRIDEVAIYPLILTPTQIASHFAARVVPPVVGFTHYSPVSVNGAGQVPSTQTDFPMLVNYTDARLIQTPTGHVANSNGYDIRPYGSIGGTELPFELEFYNPATGQVIMWVKVPSLTATTTIYLYYGHTGLTTNGSSPTTWDSNFKGVWHLGNGSVLSALDSTINANNDLAPTATATPGQIDGGALFNGTTSKVNAGAGASIADIVTITISAWVRATSVGEGSLGRIIDKQAGFTWFVDNITAGNVLSLVQGFSGAQGNWSSPVNTVKTDGTKQFFAVTYNRGSAANVPIFYVSGAAVTVTTNTSPVGTFTSDAASSLFIGNNAALARTFDGMLDELRVSNVARSAAWIGIEFRNQNAPTTFASLLTEVPL